MATYGSGNLIKRYSIGSYSVSMSRATFHQWDDRLVLKLTVPSTDGDYIDQAGIEAVDYPVTLRVKKFDPAEAEQVYQQSVKWVNRKAEAAGLLLPG